MAKRYVGEIIISQRVVEIGHEVYPLANISRVRTAELVWRGRHATLHPLRQLLLLAIAYVLFLAATRRAPARVPVGDHLDAVSWIAGVLGLYFVAVLFYRVFLRRTRYALLVETSGTQYTALSGTDLAEIRRIKSIIVEAIEHPPAQAMSVEVHGDVVVGDKVGRDQFKAGAGGNSFSA
ncbi:DUF6232 family protein [Streptomyces sp. NPDC049577]|uniref:DUF6232 family protein n=1 Tax=Streptomyces sp. NPDC049577 TaxID=3155153 RepID=UPI0034143FED